MTEPRTPGQFFREKERARQTVAGQDLRQPLPGKDVPYIATANTLPPVERVLDPELQRAYDALRIARDGLSQAAAAADPLSPCNSIDDLRYKLEMIHYGCIGALNGSRLIVDSDSL